MQNPGDNKQFMDEIRGYYSAAYLRVLNLESVENKQQREYLRNSHSTQSWGHKNRFIFNMQMMKHRYAFTKTDMLTTSFKVARAGTSCIYAYMHSKWTPGKRAGGRVDHEFVCMGPTFQSQDGEYRSRVITYDQCNALFEKYSKQFARVEAMIVSKVETSEIELSTDIYYPRGFSGDQRKFEDSINTQRLPIRLYLLCWIVDFHNIHTQTMENHINPAYQYIVYQSEDVPVYNAIVKELSAEGYASMMGRISRCYADVNGPDININQLQVGQKIFPLTVFEALRTDDVNYNVWRELYITNLASNLVLNLVSPSFAFINNWFYIQNSHGALYDNMAMHDKYTHSEIANEISAQIKNTDKANYISRQREKGLINNKFAKLSRTMQKSIVYADSDIRLTNLSVCLMSEYVGRTLRDIPALISAREHEPGLDLVLTDSAVFTKHMFEFVYAFACMNVKIGVMHGDLHMNNATINRLYFTSDSRGNDYIPGSSIAYVIDDDVYLFKHIGLFSTVIDFSRGIFGDYARIEHEFSSRFAELYFKEQRLRVMNLIYHYFPQLIENHRDKVEALIVGNFALVFKIISAIDTLVIMSNIYTMVKVDPVFREKIKVADASMKLLDTLAKHAERLIVKNMNDAIDGRITNPGDIEWPNLEILHKNFSKHKLTDDKMKDPTTHVVDVFNFNNELTYDVEDYDSWGPLLSSEHELQLMRKYKLSMPENIKRWVELRSTDELNNINELVAKYKHDVDDVLQYESWMLM